MSILLLLYYLDLRREAFNVALAQLVAVGATTVLVIALGGPPALGAAIGSVLPTLYALAIVRRSMISLLTHTFQSQPCGTTGRSNN